MSEQPAQRTLLQLLWSTTEDLIFITMENGRLLHANPAFYDVLGYDWADYQDLDNRWRHVHPDDRQELADRLLTFLNADRATSDKFENRFMTASGKMLWLETTVSKVEWQGERHLLFIARDITPRKEALDRLAFWADHDHLTELLNRHRFERDLSEVLTRSARTRERGAVLWIDVDHLKAVNERDGYRGGDTALMQCANRLRAALGEAAIVARIGGDEMAVLLPEAEQSEAERLAEALLAELRSPFMPNEQRPIRLTASIGVTLFPDHGLTTEQILTNADLTMRWAKQQGGDGYRVYTAEAARHQTEEQLLGWGERIRAALEGDRFVLHAQPVWDVQRQEQQGAEALLRLQGENGPITPNHFLPAARRLGLMGDIDGWVIEAAMAQLARRDAEAPPSCLEVNLSADSLSDETLLDRIEAGLAETGIDPTRLTFEVTETDAIANVEQSKAFINRLKELGCKFALDDFGVGFSSFYHLKHLAVDYLKIDGSFIRDLPNDPVNQRLVRSIVEMARALEMQTIAEFVEQDETVELLREAGVDFAQGFRFGMPASMD